MCDAVQIPINLKSNHQLLTLDHFNLVFRMLRLRDRLEQGRLSHSLPDMRQEGASPAGEGGFQDGFQGGFQEPELRDQGVGYRGIPVQGQELRLTNLSSKALDQQRLGHYSTQRYIHFNKLASLEATLVRKYDRRTDRLYA